MSAYVSKHLKKPSSSETIQKMKNLILLVLTLFTLTTINAQEPPIPPPLRGAPPLPTPMVSTKQPSASRKVTKIITHTNITLHPTIESGHSNSIFLTNIVQLPIVVEIAAAPCYYYGVPCSSDGVWVLFGKFDSLEDFHTSEAVTTDPLFGEHWAAVLQSDHPLGVVKTVWHCKPHADLRSTNQPNARLSSPKSLDTPDTTPPTISSFTVTPSIITDFPLKIPFSWVRLRGGLWLDPVTQTYVSNVFDVHFQARSNWYYTAWCASSLPTSTWIEYPLSNSYKPSRLNIEGEVMLAIDGGKRFYQLRAINMN